MIKTAQALTAWFSRFGVPVYLENDVPDGAEPPYITIPLKDPDWRKQVSYQIMLWDRATSNIGLINRADAIANAVGEGVRLPFDGGLLVMRIDTDTPAQLSADDDFRYVRLPFVLNAYHMPGA